MKLKEIIQAFETFAPLSLQEPYDNSGLLVGHPDDEIKSAILCIDCTPEVIAEAVSKKVDLVICHHPIIFGALKRLTGSNYVETTVIEAIKHQIAIYACHTNIDNTYQGVSYKMAEKIGLANCQVLMPKKGLLKKLVTFCPFDKSADVLEKLFSAGAGHIGDYDGCSYSSSGTGTFRAGDGTNPYVGKVGELHKEQENRIEVVFPNYLEKQILRALLSAHPYEEVAYDIYQIENEHLRMGSGIVGELPTPDLFENFLTKLKKVFSCQAIRFTEKIGDTVSKVALCGGSGSFLLPSAMTSKADVFISADFKYHDFFDADGRLSIIDIGHYESEQFTTELFAEIISKNFPTFAVYFSDINTNPIKTF